MTYFANPANDLPVAWKPRRVIIYAQGLKVYGLMPYILARRLQAKFVSNDFSVLGGMSRVAAPTMDDNYTLISWLRTDGTPHGTAVIDALLDWLYADAGFQIGVATLDFFYDRLDEPNIFKSAPRTFIPAINDHVAFFRWALQSGKVNHADAERIIEVDNARRA